MSKYGIALRSDEVRLKGSTAKLSDWQNTTDPSMIDRGKIYPGSLARYRNASGSGTIGVSGSPATLATLALSSGYHTLVPLRVSYSISGLGTGETFNLYITAVLDDGTEVTLYSATGLSAGGAVGAGDLDYTAVGDGRRVTEIRVKFESSATATSATGSATISALEM